MGLIVALDSSLAASGHLFWDEDSEGQLQARSQRVPRQRVEKGPNAARRGGDRIGHGHSSAAAGGDPDVPSSWRSDGAPNRKKNHYNN